MLYNHFKTAFRRLQRNKLFSTIHIFGLAVGIAAFLLIVYYISIELSYETVHRNKERIYRIAYQQYENGNLKSSSARNFIGLPALISEQVPEIKIATAFDRTAPQAHFLFSYQDHKHYEQESFYQADSNFFKVFPSLLVSGDPSSVLSDPHNLVVSEKIARKLFGNEDPLGKRLINGSFSYSDVSDFVITGVMKDIPANAHFHMNFLARNSHTDELEKSNYWSGPRFYTYAYLNAGTDAVAVEGRLNSILEKMEKENPLLRGARIFLQPISDIHLTSDLQDELEVNGSQSLIYVLAMIGIIILVLAWINYANIETARFVTKTKEVGIRRIVGSSRAALTVQFLVEYLLLTGVALLLAFLIVWIAFPQIEYFSGIDMHGLQWHAPKVWVGAILLFIMGSILAGVYPALYLVKLNPVKALRKSQGKRSGMLVRHSLMLIQFTSTLSLVAIVLVVSGQLDLMRLTNKKLDLDQVITIRNPSVYTNDDDSINFAEYGILKSRLMEHTQIKGVTSSSVIPGIEIDEDFTNRLKRDLNAPFDPTRYKLLFIDYDFIPFYNIRLLAGRNYSIDLGDEEDWNKIVLNEAAVHALGFTSASEAVNQEINFHLWGRDFKKYKIVGVVEDYHHEAIKKVVLPTILSLNHGRFQQVFYSVKLKADSHPQEGLAYIEKCWKEAFPDKPFSYYFQDAFYDQQFKSELYFGRIFGLFSAVAVFIAGLGVLGMTLFESNSRMKELSIRKVLGATMSSLLYLLSREYLRLILISSLISIPVLYYFAGSWLMSYPTRIELNPLFLLLPLLLVVVLVVIVSGFDTVKAARSNPTDHLRHDA